MSRRAAAWLAWSLWALCVVFVVLAVLLYFYTSSVRPHPRFVVAAGVPLLVYPTIGAFIASGPWASVCFGCGQVRHNVVPLGVG